MDSFTTLDAVPYAAGLTRIGHSPARFDRRNSAPRPYALLVARRTGAVVRMRDVHTLAEHAVVFPAARLRLNAAQLLTMDGRYDDAAHQLRIAEGVFAQMGAVRELRIVRERLRLIGARPKRAYELSVGEKGLTEREKEIVDRVALGRTNKEIATELRVAVRTVDAHLRKIFAKVGW